MSLDEHGVNKPTIVARSRNAYMLIYERAAIAPNQCSTDAEKQPTPAAGADQDQDQAATAATATDMQVATAPPIPPKLFARVWRENFKFVRDQTLFDASYFAFVNDLISINPIKPVHGVLQALTTTTTCCCCCCCCSNTRTWTGLCGRL
jgi:hypothetical protein